MGWGLQEKMLKMVAAVIQKSPTLQKQLNKGVGKGRNCSYGKGVLKVSLPLPPHTSFHYVYFKH